jgi:hemerythrin
MAIYYWKKSLSVGIDEIDSQHKQLIEYINQLHNIIEGNKGKNDFNNVFNALFEYTKNHFSLEEKLMEKYNYSLFNAHKSAHNTFSNEVERFYSEYLNGKSVEMKLVSFLGTWLVTHIAKDDKDYCTFMKPVVEKESNSNWYKSLVNKIWKN